MSDDYVRQCITQLAYHRFATRHECMTMPLVELSQFYEDLADEAERQRKEAERLWRQNASSKR
jgi:hypothetical protein